MLAMLYVYLCLCLCGRAHAGVVLYMLVRSMDCWFSVLACKRLHMPVLLYVYFGLPAESSVSLCLSPPRSLSLSLSLPLYLSLHLVYIYNTYLFLLIDVYLISNYLCVYPAPYMCVESIQSKQIKSIHFNVHTGIYRYLQHSGTVHINMGLRSF